MRASKRAFLLVGGGGGVDRMKSPPLDLLCPAHEGGLAGKLLCCYYLLCRNAEQIGGGGEKPWAREQTDKDYYGWLAGWLAGLRWSSRRGYTGEAGSKIIQDRIAGGQSKAGLEMDFSPFELCRPQPCLVSLPMLLCPQGLLVSARPKRLG